MQNFTKEELEKEVWKDVPGYEGLYQVSDLGRVKSLKYGKERILKPGVNTVGYYQFVLCKNGKRQTRKNHQLVAMAFLNHIPCGIEIQVNHKDEVITNNRLTNLEILTHEEHINFTYRNSTSKYKGVCFDKLKNKWRAQITINGQQKNLGRFSTELEAHKAVQKVEEMAKNGDFSFMNPKEYSSKYRGVSFCKSKNKWRARITINGQTKFLGYFHTELEAHKAVQKSLENLN